MNKIAAAVLVAGIIAMVTGYLTDAFYHPNLNPEKRGYEIEVPEVATEGAPAKPAGPVDILAFMGAANAEAGQKLLKKCTACHGFDKGGKHNTGPNLYGIVGRKQASASGYAYSDGLKALGGNWGFQDMSEFLTKPKKYAPGTKMVFAGLKKPEQRANLIAYLNSVSDSPLPVPAYTPPVEEAPLVEKIEQTPTEAAPIPAVPAQ